MLHPNDNAAEIMARHEEKIQALELALKGLVKAMLLFSGINLISKILNK